MEDKGPKTLLLVEDEVIIALNQKMTLEKFGYQVKIVHSGEKAAEKILVTRHVPIVFLTSHTEREYVERVKRITRYGYVIRNSGEFVLWDTIEVAFELFEANNRNEQANRELNEANEQLERFFSVNLDLLCIADTEGHFMKLNTAWEEILGYRIDQLGRSKFLDFVHPEDLDSTVEALERLSNQEELINFVNRYRSKDGSYRYIEWRSHPSGTLIYSAARDVTDRVTSENALRESEQAYRNLFERAPVGIFRTDSDGKPLAANTAMAHILGFDSAEPALEYYSDLGSQLYFRRERGREFTTILEEHGYVQNFEYEAVRPDGRQMWLSMNARKSETLSAGGFEIEGFTVDITERKNAQEAIKESENRFRRLVENAPDAIFVQTNENFSYLNPAALELFGASRPEEVIGTSVVDRFHENDREQVRGRILKLNTERIPVPRIEETCLRLDGTEIPTEVSAAPFDYEGEQGAVVFVRDMTRQKELERKQQRAAEESEAKAKQHAQWLELTVAAAHMAWWQIDLETGSISFDEQNTSILGYTPEGFDHYESFTTLIHPEDYGKVEEAMRKHLRGEAERYEAEYRIKKSSGEYVWFYDVGAVIQRSSDGSPLRVAGIFMDVTDRKRDREHIETLLREEELLLKEVHHRIKNNMHTMMSLLSLEGQSTDDPGVAEALTDARGRLQSMEVLYEKLYRSGQYQEMPLNEYLPPLLDDIVNVSPKASKLSLSKEVEPIRMDVKSLSSIGLIVTELITNALKHGFRDRDTGSISVSVTHSNGWATLTVEDDGAGLSSEIEAAGAKGFGITLINALTEQLGGTFTIESDNGTRDIVEFPVSEIPDAE